MYLRYNNFVSEQFQEVDWFENSNISLSLKWQALSTFQEPVKIPDLENENSCIGSSSPFDTEYRNRFGFEKVVLFLKH
jgi:hypothetical protein